MQSLFFDFYKIGVFLKQNLNKHYLFNNLTIP